MACAQVIQQSLMLKHTGVSKQGLWLNSAEILLEVTVPSLECLQWPYKYFFRDFFQLLLNKDVKEKAKEVNLKNLLDLIYRMKYWQGKASDSIGLTHVLA